MVTPAFVQPIYTGQSNYTSQVVVSAQPHFPPQLVPFVVEAQQYPTAPVYYGDRLPSAPPKSGQNVHCVKVIIPQGVGPGGKLQVQTPTGQVLPVTIPPGKYPGQEMLIEYS